MCLNDASVLSENHSENEALALGLRDANTHEPVELVAVDALFRHGETQARRIPKYLIRTEIGTQVLVQQYVGIMNDDGDVHSKRQRKVLTGGRFVST